MRTMALVAAATLLTAGVVCARTAGPATAYAAEPAPQHVPRDNTAVNVRDRGGNTVTPENQSENAADRKLTQQIRRAIVADDALSTNAKNVKVITIDGVVTLRGPVANEKEKNAVAAKVNGIPGVKRLDNQLEAAATR